MLQKSHNNKQFNVPINTEKTSKPESGELKSILNLENFFSSQWNSLKETTGNTEWETLQLSNFSNTDKNGPLEIGEFLHELFEHTKIGKFGYYHRAGKTTFFCEYKYDQKDGKIIEKFITDVIIKELNTSNIHVISKENHVSVVFR